MQPSHIIGYTRFKWKLRGVAECLVRPGQICLGEILIMCMRIIEIIRLKVCLQRAIQNKNQLVKRSGLTAAEIINPTRFRIERANRSIDHILHVNEVTPLLAVFENAWALARGHLLAQMLNYAR